MIFTNNIACVSIPKVVVCKWAEAHIIHNRKKEVIKNYGKENH